MKKKKILLLSYYWPPASGPAVNRMISWVNHLCSEGHTVHILTVQNPNNLAEDPQLVDEVPETAIIHRTKTYEPFGVYKWLKGKKNTESTVGLPSDSSSWISKIALHIRLHYFVPDPRIGWKYTAIKKAVNIIKKIGIEVMISSSPPHSTQVIAYQIKQKTGVVWWADLRDPWTKLYHYDHKEIAEKVRKKHEHLESICLKEADKIITIGHKIKDSFSVDSKKIEVIFNGYPTKKYTLQKKPIKDFTISYIGNFSAYQLDNSFWDAFATFHSNISPQRVSFRLVGNIDQGVRKKLTTYGLMQITEHLGYQPHKAALEFMYSSSVLLLIIPKAANNDIIITSKMFEYLKSETPTLAIGPLGGEAESILSEFSYTGYYEYSDKQGILDFLTSVYNSPQQASAEDRMNIKKYARSNQAKHLSTLLEKLE